MIPPTTTTSAAGSVPAAPCAVHPLRPALAACRECGKAACVSCANVLAPGETICSACDERTSGAIPWEDRRRLGVLRAFGLTLRGALLQTPRFFVLRTPERTVAPALAFGLVMHLLDALATVVTNLVFADEARAAMEQGPFAREMAWTLTPQAQLLQLALAPVSFVVSTFVVAGFWWLGLRAVSGLRRGFDPIVRALCYAQATNLVVPFVAPLPFLLPGGAGLILGVAFWQIGIQIVAVSRMQGIELPRGILAFCLVLAAAGSLLCLATLGAGWIAASHIHLPR
jgi:hypothetical protein